MSVDPKTVRDFEYAGWEKAAAEYRTSFAGATQLFGRPLLDAAGVGRGVRVLDLACGPGLLAIEAARRGAITSGLDFSPAMLALARAISPDTHFWQGDAGEMPIPSASLDAVVSNFGVHHFPRTDLALVDVLRVLRTGSRFAFTTWADPVENIAWQLVFDAIRQYGDMGAAKTPPSGGNLGTGDAVLRLLTDTGFAEATVETVRRDWRLATPGDLVASLRRGTVRTAALIEAQDPAAMPAILAAVERAAVPYRRGDQYAVPVVAILARGVKA